MKKVGIILALLVFTLVNATKRKDHPTNMSKSTKKVCTFKDKIKSAIEANDLDKAKQLIKDNEPENYIKQMLSIENFNFLHLASFYGFVDIVQNLINESDVNSEDVFKMSLLIASRNGHVEVVKLLLEAGANKEAVANNGTTPLYIASRNGHVEVVKILLEAGANNGATPLVAAIQQANSNAIQVLLKNNSNIVNNLVNTNYAIKSSINLAEYKRKLILAIIYNNQNNIDGYLQMSNLRQVLSILNSKDTYSEMTPLIWAVARKQLNTVQKLLNKKINNKRVVKAECIDIDGDSALSLANKRYRQTNSEDYFKMAEAIYKYLQPKREVIELIVNHLVKDKQHSLSFNTFPKELFNHISEFIYGAQPIK